jgi:DUF3048 family protein
MKRLITTCLITIALTVACSSARPTLSIPPTLAPTSVGGGGPVPTESGDSSTTEPAIPTALAATATLAPTSTPPAASDAANCPFTGLPVSASALAQRRPILVQIGNSSPERPQFGLAQADLVFETVAEGGITRFSAIYLCQDAAEIAGVRSGRLIDLQLVPIFHAIFMHVGASAPVQAMFEENALIGPNSLDYFRNHPGFVQHPDRRRAPFDVFTSTDLAWAAARQQGIAIPGEPPPTLNVNANPLAGGGGTAVASVTIQHHSSYWVRWKWDEANGVWTRYITNDTNPNGDTPHVDAATGRPLTAENVIIIRAAHRQTDIIEDSGGSRSIEVELTGSGEAVFLRDGQLYEGTWNRANTTDWFTLTLKDGSAFAFSPGNSYIHFFQPDKQLDVVTR